MDLSKIKAPRGANKRIKRRGRGQRSGHGKTSCRGHKGAGSRAGTTTHMGFEGGQMPLIRRIPKRGFNCDKSVAYQVVSIEKLVKYFGAKEAVIDAEKMKAKGLIKKVDGPVKILGDGEVAEAVTVKATAFSKSAKGKIEKAGGKAEIVRFAD